MSFPFPNASENDRETARRLRDKQFPGVEHAYALFTIPLFELIESSFVEAVSRGVFSRDDYINWRQRGAPEDEVLEAFAADAKRQRQDPSFAAELVRIEELESLVSAGSRIDPLIGCSLGVPLSSGEEALFLIDGRHRLLAAMAVEVPELEVYVGSRPDQAPRIGRLSALWL